MSVPEYTCPCLSRLRELHVTTPKGTRACMLCVEIGRASERDGLGIDWELSSKGERREFKWDSTIDRRRIPRKVREIHHEKLRREFIHKSRRELAMDLCSSKQNKTQTWNNQKELRHTSSNNYICMQRFVSGWTRVWPNVYMLHTIYKKNFESSYFWFLEKIWVVTVVRWLSQGPATP
jgi:hypothetical protein